MNLIGEEMRRAKHFRHPAAFLMRFTGSSEEPMPPFSVRKCLRRHRLRV